MTTSPDLVPTRREREPACPCLRSHSPVAPHGLPCPIGYPYPVPTSPFPYFRTGMPPLPACYKGTDGDSHMKRLLLVLFAALLLGVHSPSPATARGWPWGHHSKSKSASAAAAPADAEAAPKKSSKPKNAKTPKAKHEKHQQASGDHLYSMPKSVGWLHKGPGPAGAGS